MTHLNQCLLLNIKKDQQCHVQKSITLSEHFHLQGLFKDKHSKKLKFQQYVMAILNRFFKVFQINK